MCSCCLFHSTKFIYLAGGTFPQSEWFVMVYSIYIQASIFIFLSEGILNTTIMGCASKPIHHCCGSWRTSNIWPCDNSLFLRSNGRRLCRKSAEFRGYIHWLWRYLLKLAHSPRNLIWASWIGGIRWFSRFLLEPLSFPAFWFCSNLHDLSLEVPD